MKNNKGLSMIEVIISIAIIGIIASGLLSASTNYITMIFNSKDTTKELMTAQQSIELEISEVKTTIKNGGTPIGGSTYVLYEGETDFERNVDGYIRKISINNNPDDLANNKKVLYTVVTDNVNIYQVAEALNVSIDLYHSNTEVVDSHVDDTSLNIKSDYTISDPDSVNMTNLHQWYVTRKGFNIPVYDMDLETIPETDKGTKYPRFPDDYYMIPLERSNNLDTIKDEYAGNHIMFTVTPAAKSGKMGASVTSNSVFINGLPESDNLVLHLDASMIDEENTSCVRVDTENTFVEKWKDMSAQDNHANEDRHDDQPELLCESFGTVEGTYSQIYETYAKFLRFTGNTSISVDDDNSIDTEDFTIFAVIRTENNTANMPIISKYSGSTGWEIGRNSVGNYTARIGNGSSTLQTSSYSSEGSDGEWHIVRISSTSMFGSDLGEFSIKIDGGNIHTIERNFDSITNNSNISFNVNGTTGYVDVAELIMYDKNIGNAKIGAIEEYLTNKYRPDPPNITILSLEDITRNVIIGNSFSMPSYATAILSNGSRRDVAVNWIPTDIDESISGIHTAVGTAVSDNTKTNNLTLNVITINYIEAITQTVEINETYNLPDTVPAIFSNLEVYDIEIDWNGSPNTSSIGTTTFTGTSVIDNTKTVSLTLQVVPKEVDSVDIAENNIRIYEGETATLHSRVLPSNAYNKELDWSSNYIGIANVGSVVTGDMDGQCTVTAYVNGTTVITAMAADDSYMFDTCNIEVLQPVESVALDNSTLLMKVGDTTTLIATVYPNDADGIGSWSSSDASIVTVNSSGIVQAIGRGEADIIFEFTMENGVTYNSTCHITAIQPVTGVEIIANTSLNIGEEATISANISPSNANNQNVRWESLDTSIATIDNNGLVTGIGGGNSTITVTTEDGGFTATCNVEVIDDLSTIQAALDDINSLSIENPNGPRGWSNYPIIKLPEDVGNVQFSFIESSDWLQYYMDDILVLRYKFRGTYYPSSQQQEELRLIGSLNGKSINKYFTVTIPRFSAGKVTVAPK